MSRVPLREGTIIEVNGVKISILDSIGKGSSCLVYTGQILEEGMILADTLVTIKEFYPIDKDSEFGIRRLDSGELKFSEVTKDFPGFKARKEQFEAGYKMQKILANSDIMEIMVKPFLYGRYGDSIYIVSDIHMGMGLDQIRFKTLAEKLSCAVRVVELFGILHEAGYLMLDFKPENLLWIKQPKMIRLIDSDSIIKIVPDDEESADEKLQSSVGVETLYFNSRYSAPRIKRLVEAGRRVRREEIMSCLKPQVNVYSLGIFLFELLFERYPSDEDLKLNEELLKELSAKYCSELNDRSVAVKLLFVIDRAVWGKGKKRFANARFMMDALNESMEQVTSQKYISKKKIVKANCTYLSYNMIEKYPLYDYARKKDSETIMNIAIIGSHSFRESLLKVMIPCGQMLKSQLNIHMFMKDAESFWKDYTSENCNPEVKRTVQCYIDGEKINDEQEIIQAEIVDRPLAAFYFHTDMEINSIRKVLNKENISYIVLTEDEPDYNCRMVNELTRGMNRKKHFVAFLTEDHGCEIAAHERVTVFPVIMKRISEGYDEAAYQSHIYNMGLNVHEYYYRGNVPRASSDEIKESYKKDTYNIESSERSALHAYYKLKSVGIDPKSPDAPYRFYREVINSKTGNRELFDEMAALEHRSWTAFLVVNGVKAVDELDDEFASYAYDGDNDWKKKDQEGHVVSHPCMKYGYPGRNLDVSMWEKSKKLTKAMQKKLDPLDLRSLEIYKTVDAIASDNKERILSRIEELETYVAESESEVIQSVFNSFCLAVHMVYNRESNSKEQWRRAVCALHQAGESVLKKNAWRIMEDIEQLMRPALFTAEYKDFKTSDEDIVRAIPKLLIQNGHIQNINSSITIVKPVARNAWENIFSSIIIQPDRLVLVPFCDEDKIKSEQYSMWLKQCNVHTEVQIRSVDQLREYGGKDGVIFIDETGSERERSVALKRNVHMRNAHTFEVVKRVLKSTETEESKKFVELFNRSVNLTVQETIMLHGASIASENSADYPDGLSLAECQSVWNLYRDLKNGKKWKIFIEGLRLLEADKNKEVKLKAMNTGQYKSIYIEYDILKMTGIKKILEKLERKMIISEISMPVRGGYGIVAFKTAYQSLASHLLGIIKDAVNLPAVHSYDVVVKEDSVLLTDDSLYVDGVVPHTVYKVGEKDQLYKDAVFEEVCRLLDGKNKDKVLQNIKIRNDHSARAFSFRYASKAVREVLRTEGAILEALIYKECKRNGVFDDIRANVRIIWPDGETENEIDVIGTKNSKTYYISAKMRIPIKEDLYEIWAISSEFGIEGEAVLVTSHVATGEKEWVEEYYPNQPIALEKRARGMESTSYIGKDGVDVFDQVNNHRRIIIASSIADIVCN